MSTSAIIDWNLCLKHSLNNVDTAKKILALFIEDLIELLPKISQAWVDKDYKLLKSYIHKLYGGSHYCGIPALSAALLKFHTKFQNNGETSLKSIVEEFEKASNNLISFYNSCKFEDQISCP